jgi:hypothetical protein
MSLSAIAHAQNYHAQLYSVYTSTATPQHYKRAAAKVLKLAPPSLRAAAMARPSIRLIPMTTRTGRRISN